MTSHILFSIIQIHTTSLRTPTCTVDGEIHSGLAVTRAEFGRRLAITTDNIASAKQGIAPGSPVPAARGQEANVAELDGPPIMGDLPAAFGTGLRRWRRYRVVVALHRAGYRGPWE